MFAAIVAMWVVLPVYVTIVNSLGTDIIGGICTWGAYSSYVMAKAMLSSAVVVTYFAPLTLMLFSYSVIVYALKHKVTTMQADINPQNSTYNGLESRLEVIQCHTF